MTCPELFGDPQRARGGLPPNYHVEHNRFTELHREGRGLIRNWGTRASDNLDCDDGESFEPFIFAWIALNGWASCVTNADRDRDYLDALMVDDTLNNRFIEGLRDANFKQFVQQFSELWPIFRSQDLGYVEATGATRRQVIEEYMGRVRGLDRRTQEPLPARYSPACWSRHVSEGTDIPTDWPHTLIAIYQVRCNLFHGYKGLHSENDVRIVSSAFRVLGRILTMIDLC